MIRDKYELLNPKKQEEEEHASQELAWMLETFLEPLVRYLDNLLDKRLVRTFLGCCVVLLRLRNAKQALLLSQMGGYLDCYEGLSDGAPAGTKRIGNLIRSLKWNAGHVEHFLLDEAAKEVKRLRERGERVIVPMDGSVIEKPESRKLEGLGTSISSKAKRLNRSIYQRLWNPVLSWPVRVIGMEWTSAIITGRSGTPRLAVMRFWPTKGDYARKLREVEEEVLCVLLRRFGPGLTFVCDRGFASGPWLATLEKYRATFLIRWIKRHIFYQLDGTEKKLWQFGQGKRYLAHREMLDTQSGMHLACDVWWTPLRHPSYNGILYLLRVRLQGKKVMYLITNEKITHEDMAFDLFFSYKRRWQIEKTFRFAKCELAIESPRVRAYDDRLKLFALVMVVFSFLLFLLNDTFSDFRKHLLHLTCHRTGKRCKESPAPLYLLHEAISHLWADARPLLGWLLPPDLRTIRVLAAFHQQKGS